MKKWIIILIMSLIPGIALMAQTTDTEEPTPQESKIRERMQEYIQSRLNLSRNEAEKFTPIFVRYFREFAQTHRAFRTDKLILQQKIIDLRLRYRTEFRRSWTRKEPTRSLSMKMISVKRRYRSSGRTGENGWKEGGYAETVLSSNKANTFLYKGRFFRTGFFFSEIPYRVSHIMIEEKGPFLLFSLLPPLLP